MSLYDLNSPLKHCARPALPSSRGKLNSIHESNTANYISTGNSTYRIKQDTVLLVFFGIQHVVTGKQSQQVSSGVIQLDLAVSVIHVLRS